MTLMAAVVEGFWSAQRLPAELKYAAGVVGWVVVIVVSAAGGKEGPACGLRTSTRRSGRGTAGRRWTSGWRWCGGISGRCGGSGVPRRRRGCCSAWWWRRASVLLVVRVLVVPAGAVAAGGVLSEPAPVRRAAGLAGPAGAVRWACCVRRVGRRLTWGRLSPWLAVAMPVEELEDLTRRRLEEAAEVGGQPGVRGGDPPEHLLGGAGAVGGDGVDRDGRWCSCREGQSDAWQIRWEIWQASDAMLPPLMIGWTFAAGIALAISLVDVFATGAGFGLYLNNRSWIEGWDVELVFKRLAQRLRTTTSAVVVAAVVTLAWGGGLPEAARGRCGRRRARGDRAGVGEPRLRGAQPDDQGAEEDEPASSALGFGWPRCGGCLAG